MRTAQTIMPDHITIREDRVGVGKQGIDSSTSESSSRTAGQQRRNAMKNALVSRDNNCDESSD